MYTTKDQTMPKIAKNEKSVNNVIDKNADRAKQAKKDAKAAAQRERRAEKKAAKQAKVAQGAAVTTDDDSDFQSDDVQRSMDAAKVSKKVQKETEQAVARSLEAAGVAGVNPPELASDTQVKRAKYSLNLAPYDRTIFESLGRQNIKRIRDDLLGKGGRSKSLNLNAAHRVELHFIDEDRARFSGMLYLAILYSINSDGAEPLTHGAAVFRTPSKGKKYRFVTRFDCDDEDEAGETFEDLWDEISRLPGTYISVPMLG